MVSRKNGNEKRLEEKGSGRLLDIGCNEGRAFEFTRPDVPVDCGGNFCQTGPQDPLPKITTIGRLFDAVLSICALSSFVGGEF